MVKVIADQRGLYRIAVDGCGCLPVAVTQGVLIGTQGLGQFSQCGLLLLWFARLLAQRFGPLALLLETLLVSGYFSLRDDGQRPIAPRHPARTRRPITARVARCTAAASAAIAAR